MMLFSNYYYMVNIRMKKVSRLGIIGGSGVYDLPGIQNSDWIKIQTNFGEPSDKVLIGNLNNIPVAFLPRHGKNHQFSPSKINYRANIEALKICNVTKIISVSAVGSLRKDLHPGTIVLSDQFIDNTKFRKNTFFDDDITAHISMSDPTCSNLKNEIVTIAKQSKINVIDKSTYICIEGPQFSTKSESLLFQKWGADIIGMTAMPEVKLSREAEMCYVNLSLITDFDCWKVEEEPVSAKIVIQNFKKNLKQIHSIITNLTNNKNLINKCTKGCQNSLDNSITTKLNSNNKITQKKLINIIKKYYNVI